MLAIRLPTEIEKRLDYLASETGRTKSFYVRKIIEDNLDDMEDIYLTDEVMLRVRAGKEPVFSLNDVEKELGLAD